MTVLVRWALFVSVLATLLLVACGGGSSSSNNLSSNSSSPSKAQGVYSGTTSSAATFETIILPNDKFYALYGSTSGNVFVVNGMLTGQGQSNNGSYTASITDFYYAGSTYAGTVSATYVPGTSVQGTISEPGIPAVSFSGNAIPASQFNYNAAASVSTISGTWTGMLLDGSTASISINSNGSFSGTDSACTFSGTITPDSSGKNFFNVSLTFGSSPCSLPNQSLSGAGVTYLLSDGVTHQLVAAVFSGSTYGTVFIANR